MVLKLKHYFRKQFYISKFYITLTLTLMSYKQEYKHCLSDFS